MDVYMAIVTPNGKRYGEPCYSVLVAGSKQDLFDSFNLMDKNSNYLSPKKQGLDSFTVLKDGNYPARFKSLNEFSPSNYMIGRIAGRGYMILVPNKSETSTLVDRMISGEEGLETLLK